MNDWLAGFDIDRDSPVIGLGAFAIFFVACVIFVMMRGEKADLATFQFYLAHAIFVPVMAFLTIWCYQHPEQVENVPYGWQSDMRTWWPIFVVFDGVLIALFIRAQRGGHGKEALRLMRLANRLLAEGRIEEADAAYAKGRWILDHKCNRK